MTKDEWVIIWQYMLDRCTAANVTERNLKAYYDDLQEFDTEVVMQAARSVVRQGNAFFPPLAAIYQECLRISPQSSEYPLKHEAWENVLAQFKTWHPDALGTTEYAHPLIEKALKSIGGLRVIAEARNSELISHRAQFYAAYDAFVEREKQNKLSPKLLPTEQRPALNAAKQSVLNDITGAVTQRLTTK